MERGDYDHKSDKDILVIVRGKKDREKILERFVGEQANISVYGIDRLRAMHTQGHLFVWHLFKEAKFIGDSRMDDVIHKLGRPSLYKDAGKDISNLRDLFETCVGNLNSSNPIYEKGLIYVSLRNTSISSSWYASTGLDFTRYSPYSNQVSNKYFEIPISVYDHLIDCRLATTRGIEPKHSEMNVTNADIETMRKWFDINYTIATETSDGV
jgi:hypothetical protein